MMVDAMMEAARIASAGTYCAGERRRIIVIGVTDHGFLIQGRSIIGKDVPAIGKEGALGWLDFQCEHSKLPTLTRLVDESLKRAENVARGRKA